MNVKLSYDIDFSAVAIIENSLIPVDYELTMHMYTATENNQYQNIAMQRVQFFIKELIHHSTFIDRNSSHFTKVTKMFDTNIVEFPEDPFDQIVGLVLLQKLTAITEGKYDIERLEIGSQNFSGLRYTVDEFINFSDVFRSKKSCWWNRNDLTINNLPKNSLAKATWKDVGLEWDMLPTDSEIILELDGKLTNPDILVVDGVDEEEDNES